MSKCPNCQAEVAPDAVFCAECGTKMPTNPAPQSSSPADADQSARPRTGKETIVLPAASLTPPTARLPDAGVASTTRLSEDPPVARPPGEAKTIIAPPTPSGAPMEGKTIISSPPTAPSAPASPPAAWSSPTPQAGGQVYSVPSLPPSQPAAKPGSGRRVLLIIALVAGLGFLTLVALIVGVVMLNRGTGTATRPTAVVRPTAGAAPTAAPVETFGATLLEDDFENPRRSSLSDGENEDATYTFADGTYAINLKTPKYIVWSTFKGTYDDAAVEVDTTLDGPSQSAAGLMFRYQDSENFYLFQVSGDGRYGLDVYENDELTTLIDWTDSSEINGTGEANRLRVETEGSVIRLFVNGELLEEISDDTFADGEMALAVNTFDEGDATVTFDNLIVRGAK